jgi:hypothetical protein
MSGSAILCQPEERVLLLQISESRLGHLSERSTEQIRELLDSPLSRGFETNPSNSDPLAR